VDSDFLLSLVGGDRKVAREVLADFLKSDSADRRALAAALAAANADEIRLHAHRIKGAARSIGAEEYAQSAQAVEHGSPGDAEFAAVVQSLEDRARDLSRWAETF
jgi:HPt (histidine-containing phosphotransfer) domain-containing protein